MGDTLVYLNRVIRECNGSQVGTQMVLEDLGGIIFFTDPLTAHPHAEDIATLLRMADMNNVMHATNPTTALALVPVLDAVARGSAACGHKSEGPGQPPRFSL